MADLERTEPEGDDDGPTASPLSGTTIDRFTVLEPLGAGGMGIVVAAHDPRLDRRVALKLLGADTVRATGRDRLLREGQAMARLSHPNVVAVHEAGSVGDEVFLVMELVEGRTLRAWLAEAPRSWREILDAFIAAGHGLAAAHRGGLVHRDFKPDNVLVGKDGRVRVTDFGLALQGHESGSGSIAGTPLYMAPEQKEGAELDARVDQWAFCASLDEALGDRAISGRLRAAVLRGQRRDPAERFPSMDALVAELEDIPRRRRRLALGGSALGIAGVAGAIAFVVATRARSEPDRCRSAASPLAAVWNPERRARLHDAIAAVKRAGAPATADRVASILDERAAAWTSMRIETCQATWKRGTQSQALLDLRMHCLDQRLGQLGALVTAMSSNPDDETVDRGVALATSAMPLDRCADEKALTAAFPPPEDPAQRERVTALELRLDEAKAELDLGRYQHATALMTPLLVEIRAASFPPLLARALLERGDLHVQVGEHDAADQLMREGVQVAATAHDSILEADLWSARMIALAQARKPKEALALLEAARAALVRAGDPPRERAHLLAVEATSYLSADDYDAALERFEKALALQREVLGPAHPDLIQVLQSLSTITRTRKGDFVTAERYSREALAIAEKQLGRDHPDTIDSLRGLAECQGGLGKLDDAAATLTDALARSEAVHGPHALVTAHVRRAIGTLAVTRRDFVQARAMYEAAIPDLAPDASDHATALLNYCNGWVSSDEGVEWGKESEAICRRARDAAITAFGASHPRAALATIQLAFARMMQGHSVEAEADFRAAEAALAGHPYLVHALNGLGLALSEQGKYAEAIATCRRLIAFLEENEGDPRHIVEAHITLAAMYGDWGKKREATVEAERALVLAKQPGMPDEYRLQLEDHLEELRQRP